MYFSYVFLLILPITLLERCVKWKKTKLMLYCEIFTVITLFCGIASYCHYANGEYLSLQLSYEQASSYCTTLVTQIKSVNGYSDDLPIVFVGHDISDESLYTNDVMSKFSLSGKDSTLVEAYSREYLFRYYCGFEPQYASIDLVDKDKVKEMPLYPNEGSIQILDDIIIVKLSEWE